jgi:hypothetical protein
LYASKRTHLHIPVFRQTNAINFSLSELNQVVVRHRPQFIPFSKNTEAEDLLAESEPYQGSSS